MMASRSIITSFAASSLTRTNAQTRSLSTHGVAAVEKLKGALEEYRVKNYTQEIPSRFKKDIIRAARQTDTNSIGVEGMQRVMANINMEHKVSRSDMETIFREIGGEACSIPADRFMSII